MSCIKNWPSLFSATALALLTYPASDLQAKDLKDKSYFADCPVNNAVRVSNAQSAQRFEALSNCTDRIVQARTPSVDQLPPVTRIIGVKSKDDDGAKKKKLRTAPNTGAIPEEEITYNRARRKLIVQPAYDGQIRQVAARYRIDPLFLHAMVAQESSARPQARSHKGALGLMQIMPSTGAMLGVTPAALFDPATNLDAGARYLKKLQKRFGTDFALILSAYNAGEGAVQRYGNRIPPFAETQAYVTNVMGRYGDLRLASTGR